MKHYPLFMDVEGRECLVVGAGNVAARKVRTLVECGARVTVVGEHPVPALRRLEREGGIRLRERRFRRSDMKSYALVFGATDDPRVHDVLSGECLRRGIPVNIADDPDRSTFILPSLYRRGGLTVAVSTGGRSPAAARAIREDLGRRCGREWADLVALLGEHRDLVRRSVPGHRRREALWREIVDGDILGTLRREGRKGAARALRGRIAAASGKERKT